MPLDALQPATSSTAALNWSGYVARSLYNNQGSGYTMVSGSWIVPNVGLRGDTGTGADATWVGIGGVNSHDLIQAGTEAVPDDAGSIVYQAWLEELPGTSQIIPLDIHPGDSISASITESSPNEWLISLRDNTTGENWSDTQYYISSHASAEWIEELPIVLGSRIGLDNFGTLRFTNGSTIYNGQALTIAQTGARALTMTNAEGASIATPSVLAADGQGFTVTRQSGEATPLTLGRYGVTPVLSDTAIPQTYRVVSFGGHRRNGWRVLIIFN
jgi:hypothetical protein